MGHSCARDKGALQHDVRQRKAHTLRTSAHDEMRPDSLFLRPQRLHVLLQRKASDAISARSFRPRRFPSGRATVARHRRSEDAWARAGRAEHAVPRRARPRSLRACRRPILLATQQNEELERSGGCHGRRTIAQPDRGATHGRNQARSTSGGLRGTETIRKGRPRVPVAYHARNPWAGQRSLRHRPGTLGSLCRDCASWSWADPGVAGGSLLAAGPRTIMPGRPRCHEDTPIRNTCAGANDHWGGGGKAHSSPPETEYGSLNCEKEQKLSTPCHRYVSLHGSEANKRKSPHDTAERNGKGYAAIVDTHRHPWGGKMQAKIEERRPARPEKGFPQTNAMDLMTPIARSSTWTTRCLSSARAASPSAS